MPRHYTRVTEFDLDETRVKTKGPIMASSESFDARYYL